MSTGREVIGGGGQRRPGVPVHVWLLLGAIVGLLLVGDGVARRLEADALLDRARQGQATVAFADRRVTATVQYASPQLTSPDAPAAVRADLQALVRREAAGQVASLRRRRDQADRTPVLPWHRPLRRARTAYVAHLDARLARLQAVSQDLSALYIRPPGLEEQLQAARTALAAAAGAARTQDVLGAAGPGTVGLRAGRRPYCHGARAESAGCAPVAAGPPASAGR